MDWTHKAGKVMPARARIFRPSKTAMQSGKAKTHAWILEYEPESAPEADPLMGWTSSNDMKGQIRLRFASKEEAIAYAEAHGIAYQFSEPEKKVKPVRAYADNFKYDRIGRWTH
jgi:hypothetical protein